MPRPKDQRERKRVIVEAGARAIAATGVSGLRVRDVAEQAGISAALVSYYYRHLDDLVLDVHAHASERFCAARRAAAEAHEDPVDQLAELVDRGVPATADDLLCRVLYELHVHAARSPSHAALMSALWEQEVSLYEVVLERGRAAGSLSLGAPAREVAETFVALEDALGLHVVARNSRLSPERGRGLLRALAERETGAVLDAALRASHGSTSVGSVRKR
ncbi:TetR/AcrR family transcriptional regulator [Nocardioides alkalitolerans]|uniref:TetR/AcrR family transcriptional regulator n=1 Tax=Nocardioides alkalitolerans TaxID=281714 RepID=UPI00041ABDA2|nr:TetR family transcriptional regulator C-terminal domain-containing protein [Nocardioides alkalitolerans]